MGLFSSGNKNRKRRTPAKKREGSAWKKKALTPRKQSKSAKQQHHKLHAQISTLENFLAKKSVEDEEKLRMRSMNILPPPDKSRKKTARRKMGAAEKRRYLSHRNRSGMRFLTLFLIACGIVWYLLKTGL